MSWHLPLTDTCVSFAVIGFSIAPPSWFSMLQGDNWLPHLPKACMLTHRVYAQTKTKNTHLPQPTFPPTSVWQLPKHSQSSMKLARLSFPQNQLLYLALSQFIPPFHSFPTALPFKVSQRKRRQEDARQRQNNAAHSMQSYRGIVISFFWLGGRSHPMLSWWLRLACWQNTFHYRFTASL